jgi:hypothetical protein
MVIQDRIPRSAMLSMVAMVLVCASPHISHWGSGERGSRLGSVVSMTRVQECHEAVSLGERGRRPSRSDVSGSVDCAVSGACQAAAFRNRA